MIPTPPRPAGVATAAIVSKLFISGFLLLNYPIFRVEKAFAVTTNNTNKVVTVITKWFWYHQ